MRALSLWGTPARSAADHSRADRGPPYPGLRNPPGLANPGLKGGPARSSPAAAPRRPVHRPTPSPPGGPVRPRAPRACGHWCTAAPGRPRPGGAGPPPPTACARRCRTWSWPRRAARHGRSVEPAVERRASEAVSAAEAHRATTTGPPRDDALSVETAMVPSDWDLPPWSGRRIPSPSSATGAVLARGTTG